MSILRQFRCRRLWPEQTDRRDRSDQKEFQHERTNNKHGSALRELNKTENPPVEMRMDGFGSIMKAGALALILLTTRAQAGPVIPTEEGTNWTYQMTQELGVGISLPGATPDSEGKIRSSVVYRLDGSEMVDGRRFLKFEMHRDHQVTNTELVTVDAKGIHCSYRILPDGERIHLDPAQTIMAFPLHHDDSWDFDGKAGSSKVHQHYIVMGQQDISVPAGRFHAFRILGEQTEPDAMTIERWFVPGVGIIKDITTMRNADGDRVQRIELQLADMPKVDARPEVKADKILAGGLSAEPVGAFASDFSTETPRIYARWKGHNLHKDATIRAVWIAEDIGPVAPANYTIDEATAVAETPNARGSFALSKPDEGWAPGVYRVEFYVDDELIDTAKATIKPPPSPNRP
jgi:hypothetical protein